MAIFLVGVAWFIYTGKYKSNQPKWTFPGETVIADKPQNKFILHDNGFFSVDVRIFGFMDYQTSDDDRGPLAIDTHLMIVTPMAENAEIFRARFCEKASFDRASQVNVIAADKAVFKRVEELRAVDPTERKCARLSGKSLVLETEYFKGEVLTGMTATTTHPYDINKYMLLQDFAVQSCD